MDEKLRLSKLMSQRGLCSRREADYFIERGWVFVDGERVSTLGTRVSPEVDVRLASRADSRQNSRLTFLLNKPVGYVSAQAEKNYRPAVVLITPENYYPGKKDPDPPKLGRLKGLAPAGRLDIDSHGLLVLTQDGRVARTLIGPDSGIEKEYIVRVSGDITEERIEALREGLTLDGRRLRRARIERRKRPDELTFVLVEGRKRQIRRMCELVELKVTSLRRIRIGKVRLGRLPSGRWRLLRPDERFD